MEFGVYIREAETYPRMVLLAQAAEELGYSGVYLNDHVHSMGKTGSDPYLEAWTAMAGVGVETSRVRLGHITLFNSIRNPAFLAKSVATLDNMTGGRYELIIGAGWSEPEYIGYDFMEKGRGMPSAGERVSRLKESVQILRGMLHNREFSYEGKYWTLKDAYNIPQPVQQPFRISIGARQPRMVNLTAKYADGINASGDLTNVERILGLLYPALERNGKTVEEFYIHGFAPSTTLVEDERELDKVLKQWAARGTDPAHARSNMWIGTPEMLIEKWRRAMDMGMKMSIINVKPGETLEDNIEMLARFMDTVATQI